MRDNHGSSAPTPGAAPGLLDTALEHVVREVDASMGGVYLPAPDGGRALHLAIVTGIPLSGVTPRIRVVPLSARRPVADAARKRRLVWLAGEESPLRYPQMRLVSPFHFAQAASPVATGTDCWGVLNLIWRASRPPELSPRETDVITTGCRDMGLLLRGAARTGHPVLPGPEPRVVDRTDTRPSEPQAAVDFVGRLPEGCCGLDRDGRITFVNDVAAGLLGLSVPLLLGKRPWDSLPWLDSLAFEHDRAAFTGAPSAFTVAHPDGRGLIFRIYPDATGASVRVTPAEHTRHRDAAEPPVRSTRIAQLHQLLSLAVTFTEAVTVQDVMTLLADQIMPMFGAQALALFLAEDGRLKNIGRRGTGAEHLDPWATSMGDSPYAPPAFIASPSELVRAFPGHVSAGRLAAWAVLPLVTAGRPVGLCVLAYEQPHSFEPNERTVLISLAGLAAQALDRARLYDSSRQLAETLQFTLLPHALPDAPGLQAAARYLPAMTGMDIGGDFYDLIPLAGTTAAVIGDVQGHNVTAAALMGQLRIAIHAYAAAGASPGEVLSHANRLLIDLDPGLFASCLCVQLDLHRQRATLATAGHPPALLRHRDRHTEILDVPPGLLLGIDPAACYSAVEVVLPPEGVLLLYTDGLIEAPDTDLGLATSDLAGRVTHAPDQSLDGLADTLVRHAQRTGQGTDDVALLLLSWAGG
ncbi:PP2C family protein-serine/threonine phosphatase [Streptomyces fagopyri]|uniref:PP2C family protein-serine/threonine phosphatase n=1 Tax=Streptomyces fagopyri TaxID=2662397 RepID=UPI003723C15C